MVFCTRNLNPSEIRTKHDFERTGVCGDHEAPNVNFPLVIMRWCALHRTVWLWWPLFAQSGLIILDGLLPRAWKSRQMGLAEIKARISTRTCSDHVKLRARILNPNFLWKTRQVFRDLPCPLPSFSSLFFFLSFFFFVPLFLLFFLNLTEPSSLARSSSSLYRNMAFVPDTLRVKSGFFTKMSLVLQPHHLLSYEGTCPGTHPLQPNCDIW